MAPQNFLLVSFAIPNHLNPFLQLARGLLREHARITFATSESSLSHIAELPDGLMFVTFPDGSKYAEPTGISMANIVQLGMRFLRDLILSEANESCPFTCIFYTAVAPWMANPAHDMGIRSVMIWLHPATLLDIYYYYFNGYCDKITNACNDRTVSVQSFATLHPRHLLVK